MISYESRLKYAYKENKDDTICWHQCYFQLTMSTTKTQINVSYINPLFCVYHFGLTLDKVILREKYQLYFYNIFYFCLCQPFASLINNDRPLNLIRAVLYKDHFHLCYK